MTAATHTFATLVQLATSLSLSLALALRFKLTGYHCLGNFNFYSELLFNVLFPLLSCCAVGALYAAAPALTRLSGTGDRVTCVSSPLCVMFSSHTSHTLLVA